MQTARGHGNITTVARAFLGLLGAILVASTLASCARVDPKPDPPPEARVGIAPAPPPVPPPSTYVVIRLKDRRLDLVKDDIATPLASFPIAVGRVGDETPTGCFQVEEKIVHPDFQKIDPKNRMRVVKYFPPGPTNPLGERWIGFAHGDGWTLGIHGTPNPELLGKAVSHGCVRMRNSDVIRVYEIVELGTPVIVRP
jgi:lipoprotein-anchoring transpeptidase ErfK/SrfK